MEDTTGTGRLNPMGQRVAAAKGIAATHPAIQLLQDFSLRKCRKGQRSDNYE